MNRKFAFISGYLFIYLFSYLYIAYYHQTINLFSINIHESGALNFLEVLFYSSHFLAHLPVHVVIALVFIGSLKLFGGFGFNSKTSNLFVLGLLILFLILTVLHSFYFNGKTDTLEYILQKKQGHDIYGEGGSWKLHLVSTISLVFLIPVYIFLVLQILKQKMEWNKNGLIFIAAGILFIPIFSFVCEGNFLSDIKYTFTNNRYLAHSVRELITFPITYFPLFFLVFYDFKKAGLHIKLKSERRINHFVLLTFIVFLLLFVYQTILPLTEGIGNLSQKPEFTKGEKLPLLYLITTHYFEHFLDTIFFVLFSAFLFKIKGTNKTKVNN